jgi:S-adenosylmethionine hydrolase
MSSASGLISLLTDFGYGDPFVGAMKGVILGINPSARIIDLSHNVPPQDVFCGAVVLRAAAPYLPEGTIHVAVVDPGVGTQRRPLLIEADRSFYIGPDNGILSFALRDKKLTCITELNNDTYFLKPTSTTFHGRDIFAPIAAHLSLGLPPERFGSAVSDFVQLPWPEVLRRDSTLEGEIIYIDRFGNLITNIQEDDLKDFAAAVPIVSLLGFSVHGLHSNYASGAGRELVALIDSWGLLEIAQFQGNAQRRINARVGEKVLVRNS